MSIIIFALLVLGGLAWMGRLVLEIGAARRAGAPLVPLYRRFRRQMLILVLLLVLYVGGVWYEGMAAWLNYGPRHSVLHFLTMLVVLAWLIHTAGRDMQATAMEGLEERQRLTVAALEEIEAEVRERRKR
jgi:hypothetical protein